MSIHGNAVEDVPILMGIQDVAHAFKADLGQSGVIANGSVVDRESGGELPKTVPEFHFVLLELRFDGQLLQSWRSINITRPKRIAHQALTSKKRFQNLNTA